MPLIFTDTLQATDASGLYTLQALVNNAWTDIHTIAGSRSGSIEVDAALNTIAVDTALLPVGHTFDFRWVDSVGNVSNIIAALVPFTLLDYYTVDENIGCLNNGGDSWTFTIPYAPPPDYLSDQLENQVIFYNGTDSPTLVDEQNVTTTKSYNLSGNGAGTYNVIAQYGDVNGGSPLIIAQAFYMVDAAGNILRQAVFTGFTDVVLSGMDISCTARYQLTNATELAGQSAYLVLSANNSDGQVVSSANPLVDQSLAACAAPGMLLLYLIQFDPAEWTAGLAGNVLAGCVMSLTTDVVS